MADVEVFAEGVDGFEGPGGLVAAVEKLPDGFAFLFGAGEGFGLSSGRVVLVKHGLLGRLVEVVPWIL